MTTNTFNNTLKCEFLSLTNPAFPKDLAQATRFLCTFYFIFCFPRVSCYNLSLNKKVLIHSTSCLYTKHQTLVSEVFAVVFAASLSLVEDEVGTCWLLSYLCVLPCPWVVLETCYGKRVCRCQCSLSL